MSKTIALMFAVLVASDSTAALAQLNPLQGTQQEQAACRPDVQRYCKEHIPDTFRILACLQNNRARISRACRGVLESHGQ
jgi:hypothetical protein